MKKIIALLGVLGLGLGAYFLWPAEPAQMQLLVRCAQTPPVGVVTIGTASYDAESLCMMDPVILVIPEEGAAHAVLFERDAGDTIMLEITKAQTQTAANGARFTLIDLSGDAPYLQFGQI